MITDSEMRELEDLRAVQVAAGEAFNEATKATAEKHQLDPQALAKYVRARVADKLEKLRAEVATHEQLDLEFGVKTSVLERLGATLTRVDAA